MIVREKNKFKMSQETSICFLSLKKKNYWKHQVHLTFLFSFKIILFVKNPFQFYLQEIEGMR